LLQMKTQKPPEQKITASFKVNLKADGPD